MCTRVTTALFGRIIPVLGKTEILREAYVQSMCGISKTVRLLRVRQAAYAYHAVARVSQIVSQQSTSPKPGHHSSDEGPAITHSVFIVVW